MVINYLAIFFAANYLADINLCAEQNVPFICNEKGSTIYPPVIVPPCPEIISVISANLEFSPARFFLPGWGLVYQHSPNFT